MPEVEGQVTAAPATTPAVTTPATVSPVPVDNGVTPEATQAAFDAFGKQPSTEGDNRLRDEYGRFVSVKAVEPPPAAAAPSAPTVDPIWKQAAKDVYFTDDEIASFKSPELLKSAVNGRRYEFQQRYAQPQNGQQQSQAQTQQAPTPTAQSVLEDLVLETDENEDSPREISRSSKIVDKYNKIKAVLLEVHKESQALKQRLEQYEAVAQQSAQSQAVTQQAQEWDRLVADIPGIVEFAGKPSEAMSQRGTKNHLRWAALTPAIIAKAEEYAAILGPDRINESVMREIVQKAHEELFGSARPQSNGNGNGNGHVGPGAVIRPEPRRSMEEPSMTGDHEFDRSLANATKVWNSMGRNPFAGD
jgi:hypothetical protein